MSNVLSYVLARIEEPSTWAGGGIAAMAISAVAPGNLAANILQIGGAVGGLLAVVLPEKSSS